MEIDYEKFEKAQDYLMFYIFIQTLIRDGAAKFGDKNNKIIDLNHDSSNYFSIGRDESMKPFIGVQEDLMPWFFNLEWSEVALCLNGKDKRFYLVSRNSLEEIQFMLGIKIKAKRMIALYDVKSEKISDSFCNMKVLRQGEKRGEVFSSFNNIVNGLKMSIINSPYDLIEEDDDVLNYDKNEDSSNFMFIKNSRKP